MHFFDKLKNIFFKTQIPKKDNNGKFNKEKYDKQNQAIIEQFSSAFDLNSVDGIRSIAIPELKKWESLAVGTPSRPEQILKKKATAYKKEQKWDLAIECLKKFNDFLPHCEMIYSRNDFEKLVDYMVLAGRFEDAKTEHQRLNEQFGSDIDELKYLQSCEDIVQKRNEYQQRIIEPRRAEDRDREEYYWLLENMPYIAPKSFGGYRRMKKQKTDNYKEILNSARKNGTPLSKVNFWF